MPKSSIDSLTPDSLSSCRVRAAPSGSSISNDSVISNSMSDGSTFVSSRISPSTPFRFFCSNWRAERFTETGGTFSPASCQALICKQAVRRTHSPAWTISPVSSSTGMKLPGSTMPFSGCCQRRSASNPQIFPVTRSALGW